MTKKTFPHSSTVLKINIFAHCCVKKVIFPHFSCFKNTISIFFKLRLYLPEPTQPPNYYFKISALHCIALIANCNCQGCQYCQKLYKNIKKCKKLSKAIHISFLIIFWSKHKYSFLNNGLWARADLYEGSTLRGGGQIISAGCISNFTPSPFYKMDISTKLWKFEMLTGPTTRCELQWDVLRINCYCFIFLLLYLLFHLPFIRLHSFKMSKFR